jgi:hypothetical protein
MLPKILRHKRNGHRRGPGPTGLSPGEIMRLVPSDRPTSASGSSEGERFTQPLDAEWLADPGRSPFISGPLHGPEPQSEAGPRTEAAFDPSGLPDVQGTMDALDAQGDVTERMIAQLATATRRRRGNRRRSLQRRLVNLNEITEEAVTTAALSDIRVELALDPSVPSIVGDYCELPHALAGLIRYMAKLMTEVEKPIIVETTLRDSVLRGESLVRLRIRARRAAVPDDVRARLFRGPSGLWAAAKVTELDLYVASRIVGEHGGFLSAEVSPEGDPCFTLEFPAI